MESVYQLIYSPAIYHIAIGTCSFMGDLPILSLSLSPSRWSDLPIENGAFHDYVSLAKGRDFGVQTTFYLYLHPTRS